jgi:flagellar motor switch protein FliM
VLRRKIAAARAVQAEGGPGADKSWRLALARAARDQFNLPLEVASLRLAVISLAELLELPFAGGLISILQGPSEGIGLLVLSSDVVAALIEVQTLGKVGLGAPEQRKPTRTDAAMIAPFLDAALIELEEELAEEADLVWTSGFRYASFLDDPRPLGLLMEDVGYRLLQAEVSLGLGARKGAVFMVLPAKGKGRLPALGSGPIVDPQAAAQSFTLDLAVQIEAAGVVLEAILGRISLPLQRVMALQIGEVIPLGRASIDKIQIAGLDGGAVTEGKLGQNRGMRAIRLGAAQQGASHELTARRPGEMQAAAMGFAAAEAPMDFAADFAAEPAEMEFAAPAELDFAAEPTDFAAEPAPEDFLAQFGTPLAQAG